MNNTDKLQAGMLLKKGDEVFLVADSSNQRWVVDILKGTAKWFFKADEGTIGEALTKGYTYYMTTKELLEGEVTTVPEPIKVTPASIPVFKSKLEDVPEDYNPLSNFEAAIRSMLK